MADQDAMRDAGTGVSRADMNRGYTRIEEGLNVPPKQRQAEPVPAFDADINWERMRWDDEQKRYVDRFQGGFLPRDGYSTER
jgi:hypothetical protein